MLIRSGVIPNLSTYLFQPASHPYTFILTSLDLPHLHTHYVGLEDTIVAQGRRGQLAYIIQLGFEVRVTLPHLHTHYRPTDISWDSGFSLCGPYGNNGCLWAPCELPGRTTTSTIYCVFDRIHVDGL